MPFASTRPIITQTPSGGPQVWTLCLAPGTTEAQRIYTLTVVEHPTAFLDIFTGVRRTIVGVEKNSNNDPFTIQSLEVVRPTILDQGGTKPRSITVTLGENDPGTPAALVGSIMATGSGQGHVEVKAYSATTLGSVSGINNLISEIDGDVIGPVTTQTHPGAQPEGDLSDPYPSRISIFSSSGTLRENVTALPYTGSNHRGGIIEKLDFAGGQIGISEASPVEIKADEFIQEVRGKEIHARITGTNTSPSDLRFDSYVNYIGEVTTFTAAGGSGRFTGEIRGATLGKDLADLPFANFVNLEFRGNMEGRIWLQSIQPGSGFDHTIYMSAAAPAGPDLIGRISLGVINPPPADNPSVVWGSLIKIFPDSAGANQIRLDSGDAAGYTPARTASSLGGGSAGVVPFRQHTTDIRPVSGSNTLNSGSRVSTSEPIKLAYYGPVNWDAADGKPFLVERRTLPCTHPCAPATTTPGPWTDANTCFDQLVDPTNPTIVLISPNGGLAGSVNGLPT